MTSPVSTFTTILCVIFYPSYIRFMVPASKVSVPLTVVMRTRSRVPESVFAPPPIELIPATLPEKIELNVNNPVALFNNVKYAIPSNKYVAPPPAVINNPVVLFAFVVFATHAPLV